MGAHYDNKLSRVFKYQQRTLPGVVLKGVWLTVATICLITGIVVFSINIPNLGFFAWMIGGAICCIPIIGIVFSLVWDAKNEGAAKGSDIYTTEVYVSDTSVTARTYNHTVLYAIIYIVVALLVCSVLGIPLLALVFGFKVYQFIRNIIDIARLH